jgi:hypothetical protein
VHAHIFLEHERASRLVLKPIVVDAFDISPKETSSRSP